MAGLGSERALSSLAFLRAQIVSGAWPINERIPIESELMVMLGVGKTTVREAVRSLASVGMLETMPGRGTFVRSRVPVSSVVSDYLAGFAAADLLVYRRALEVESARQAARHRTEAHLAALRAALEYDIATGEVRAPGSERHGRRAAGPPDHDGPVVSHAETASADAGPAGHATSRTGWERGRTTGTFHALIAEASGSDLLRDAYASTMAALRATRSDATVVYGASSLVRTEDHRRVLDAVTAQDEDEAALAMSRHVDRDLVLGREGPPPSTPM